MVDLELNETLQIFYLVNGIILSIEYMEWVKFGSLDLFEMLLGTIFLLVFLS